MPRERDGHARRDWLTAARERAGLSQGDVAELVDVSPKQVWRWEAGLSMPKPRKRPALAAAVGMPLTDLNDQLGIAPAAPNGNSAVPFATVTDWLPWFIRAEAASTAISTVSATVLHALTQTPGYATAVESSAWLPLSADQIHRLVQQRLARSAVLSRATYHGIIAEPLLHAPLGGDQVMADQLAHMLGLADRPSVTIQVIDLEHLAATPGEFTLLASSTAGPDAATETGVNSYRTFEGPTAAENHVNLFSHLQSLAYSPEESRDLIAKSAARFAARAPSMKGTPTR